MSLSSFEPPDAQTAASMLAIAAADGISLVPEGNRTKLRAQIKSGGAPPISSTRLTTGLAHYAGDLVATAPAGATLHDVNAVLARERQWIPLDPPHGDRATIGGIVACNDSGPRRHRFGAPRDLIIGIEVALTNGRVAHSGGRVVKNVAGYDLARLFCGSRGSLGLITSVTFKLAPVAPVSRTLVARFSTIQKAAEAASTLSASTGLTPSALEIAAPHPRLVVRFESTARATEHMATSARAMLVPVADTVIDCEGDAEAKAWNAHASASSTTSGLAASISVLPTKVAAAIEHVERLAGQHGLEWAVSGRAALGVLRTDCAGDAAAQAAFAIDLRAAVLTLGGSVQVLGIGDGAAVGTDLLGPVGSSAAVGFAVKRRFDPSGVLPYPWVRV